MALKKVVRRKSSSRKLAVARLAARRAIREKARTHAANCELVRGVILQDLPR